MKKNSMLMLYDKQVHKYPQKNEDLLDKTSGFVGKETAQNMGNSLNILSPRIRLLEASSSRTRFHSGSCLTLSEEQCFSV